MQSAHFPSIHMPDDSTHPAPDARRPTATGADADPNATHAVPEASSPQMLRPAAVAKTEPRIGHLTVEREIGSGGMGVVYSVLNQRTGRREALKVPREAVRDPASLDRFRREYMIQQGLGEHPNLVRVFETGVFTDSAGVEKPYYTMECVEGGRTLRTLIDEGVPRRRLVEIMAKVAGAIAHAAQKHVHHGDLKPSNVLIRDNGEPAVSDFGVARNLSVEQSTRQVTASLGRAIGTYDYMSPEQASSASALASQTDDVYTLGVMLYEVIAGRRPYAVAPSPGVTLAEAIRRAHIAPLRVGAGDSGTRNDRNRPADPWLTRIVSKAMAKEASGRYESAREVQVELVRYLAKTRWTTSEPWTLAVPTPRRFWLGTVVATGVAVFLGFWLMLTGWMQGTELSESFRPAKTFALGSPGLDDVRVIAITKTTPLAELSKRFSPDLPPATPDSMYPFRAVHAEVARKLVRARATVVAWDIAFPKRAESASVDGILAKGIDELRESGTPTVIVATSWRRDGGMPVDVSPEIAKAALGFGGVTAQLGDVYPWKVDTLVQVSPMESVEASLSMLVYCSFIRPGARLDAAIDTAGEVATLRFWKPQPLVPGGREIVGPPVRLQLSMRHELANELGTANVDILTGLTSNSIALSTMIEMPPLDSFDRITIPIERVLEMDEAELLERFMGKAVFIGDLQTPYDQKALPADAGGFLVPGVFVQVVTTANLLAGLVPFLPAPALEVLFVLATAMAFMLPVILFRHTWLSLCLLGIASGLLVIVVARLVTQHLGMLIDPGPLLVAGALAWVVVVGLRAHVQRVWELARRTGYAAGLLAIST